MPELRPLQQEALEPLRSRWCHADPPGSGKTPVGLSWLKAHGTARALIVCPSNVVRHWERLADIWYPGQVVTAVPKGTAPSKRATAFMRSFDIYVTSYSLFTADAERLALADWDAVIFDEAHRLRGRKTLVHAAAAKVAHRTPLVDLSTGSPILNHAEEAWSMLHLLDPKNHRGFWKWAGKHFTIEETDFHGTLARAITRIMAPKPGALEAIAAEFGQSLVMRSEELMLPMLEDPEHVTYEVDLSASERRIYDSLVKHSWAVTDGAALITPNEVSKMTRLRQMASDWSSALGEEVGEKGSKVAAAVELIQDLHPNPVLVFVSFKATADALARALKLKSINARLFTGDQDEDDRTAALESFERGATHVLIGTYGALAEGTDGLQHTSHHVVLLDHDWTPEIERQAIGRLRRDGQLHRVVVHHIIARDTIDQTVADAHVQKTEVADALLGRTLSSAVGAGGK